MMFNEIRSRGYLLIGGTSAVSTVITSRVTRKLCGPVIEQRMANLMENRLESAPLFTYCAADYFGPFIGKEKHKDIKHYGFIFMYGFKSN